MALRQMKSKYYFLVVINSRSTGAFTESGLILLGLVFSLAPGSDWMCAFFLRLTWGTTPKAFLQVWRGTEFQETPSMEMSPSVDASLSRAESRVLFPDPVLPRTPTWGSEQSLRIGPLIPSFPHKPQSPNSPIQVFTC